MTDNKVAADVDINVFTRPEGISDPFKYYDHFRSMSPVPGYVDWSPGTVPGIDPPITAWAVFPYDQVIAVLKNNAVFSNRDPGQEESAAPSIMLEGHDDPEHARLRKLVSQAFTPRRIAALGDDLRAEIDHTIEELGEGTFDACKTLTGVLPTASMSKMLGLPGVSRAKLLDWAHAFMQSANLAPEARQERCVEMITVCTQNVAERQEALRARGGVLEIEEQGDLITALLLANEAGLTEVSAASIGTGEAARASHAGRSGLTPEDIVLFITTLIVAGNETSTFLSGHVLNVLGSMPEVQAQLRADRSKMNNFLDETMRLYGPVQRLFRWVLEDTEVGGVPIKKDEWVAVFYGGANRDPKMFPDPDVFDINRPNARQHTSLGHGIHYCLGAALARLNVGTMVNAVLDRYSTIELVGEPTPQTVNIFNFAYWELPLSMKH